MNKSTNFANLLNLSYLTGEGKIMRFFSVILMTLIILSWSEVKGQTPYAEGQGVITNEDLNTRGGNRNGEQLKIFEGTGYYCDGTCTDWQGNTACYPHTSGQQYQYGSPFGDIRQQSTTQFILTKSNMGGYPITMRSISFQWGYYQNGDQTTTIDYTTSVNASVQIYLKEVDASSLSETTPITSGATLVYSSSNVALGGSNADATLNGSSRWQTFSFSSAFNYSGNKNLAVIVCTSGSAYQNDRTFWRGRLNTGATAIYRSGGASWYASISDGDEYTAKNEFPNVAFNYDYNDAPSGTYSNPSVTTGNYSLNCQKATISGSCSNKGNAPIVSRGYYLSTNESHVSGHNSSYCNEVATNDNTAFSKELTGLSANTTYYYCAYFTNQAGYTGYGGVKSFTTGQSYSISTSANPSAGGTPSGGGTYCSDETCTLSTSVNEGYIFKNWTKGSSSGTQVSTNTSYSFTVSSATSGTYYANYAKEYTLTLAATNGSITASYTWNGTTTNLSLGANTVPEGAIVNISASPNGCYSFTGWSRTSGSYGTFANGNATSTTNPTTFTMGAGNATVTASFTQDSYTISALAGTGGKVKIGSGSYTTSTSQSVSCGSSCTIYAQADGCYTFSYWTKGSSSTHVGTDGNTTLTISSVSESASYTAHFTLNTYTISATADPTDGGTITGTGIKDCGSTCTLTATANSGYEFVNWTEGGTVVSGAGATYSFTVDGARTLVANFQSSGYNVTYDKNSITATGTMTDPNSPYASGSTVTVLHNDFIFAGRVFEKWNTAPDGSGISYYPEDTFTITGDVTLYAQWIEYDQQTWVQAVSSQPGIDSWEIVNGTVLIKDERGLAWFISYVNGFNGCEKHDQAKAKLCANVDMSEHIWVPIGFSNARDFYGYFDGQCYTIDGIHIANRLEADRVEEVTDAELFGVDGEMFYVGLFGKVDGTSSYQVQIKNTFVTSGTLYSWRAGAYVGGLAGAVNETTLEFCESAVTINAVDGISVGGLVGSATHDTDINGCMSMSTISSGATNIGGILGASSDISVVTDELSYVEHSFANCNLTASTSENYKMGAAVGHFSGRGYADPVYIHPNASGATNMLGDNTLTTGITLDETPRGYAFNSSMNYQYVNKLIGDVTIPSRAVYTAVAPITYTNHDSGNKVTIESDTKTLCEELNSRGFQDGTTLQSHGLRWDRVYGITEINGDYPILYPQDEIDGRVMAVGQFTGEKALRYGSVNDLITSCNKHVGGGTIYMYQTDTIRVATDDDVVVYVNENVALMQEAAKVNAVVAVTLDNSNGTGSNGQHRDWHFFSPSISGAKTGIICGSQTNAFSTDDLTFGVGNDYYLLENDDAVYFPIGISTVTPNPGKHFDLYAFYEPQYHWINLKRASANHWHEDEIGGTHPNIAYTNESTYTPGKGYMIALGDNSTYNNNLMQARGVLNNADVEATVTNQGTRLTGYNLLGNPFQSYLDFNAFANNEDNAKALWANTSSMGYKAYLVYDADLQKFDEYLVDNQSNSFSVGAATTAKRYLNMHQGFFVVKNGTAMDTATNAAKVHFTNDMRVTDATGIVFRDEVLSYPLVNLFCTDSDGRQEVSVIEMERPEMAGSLKLKGMLNGKCNMYIHWDEEDFGSIFIDHMPDYVPVWFDAAEDGIFTMSWNTANANFGYMHLIDNQAGVDYDCLANDSYTFNASTTDMSSRFRLVFKPLGIEEETSSEGENFAFVNGNELVVNGSGELSFIDLNGRVLATEYVSGEQSFIALPNVAEGMYLLRLTNANNVKVQKVVIRK